MKKKIVDIKPFKSSVKIQEKEDLTSKKIPPAKISNQRRWKIIIPLLIVLAAGFFIQSNLSKATIEIWPETEIKTFQTNVIINKNVTNIDYQTNTLPGEIYEKEKTFSEEFFASGKTIKEKKAEGVIRVYNDSQIPQTLIKNTRFQAPLEKFQPPLEEENGEYPWFRTLEAITVPAKSFFDVKVVADSPGEKYNIEPTTFSVPGLAGTPQYTLVYGKSFEPMKGGLKQESPAVTEEDLQKAKDNLIEKTKKEMAELIKKDIPQEFIFVDDVLETEIIEAGSLIKAGMEFEKFNYQVKVKSQTLIFKKEDIENLVQKFILSQISEDKKIHKPALKIKYLPRVIDLKSGKITLNLEIEAKIFPKIDEVSFKKGLAEKSLSEVKIFLENEPKIIKSQIRIWPFWLKHIPKDIEKIKIKLMVDPTPSPIN